MIERHILLDRYVTQSKSMQQIATELECSLNKVAYYMDKYDIARRSISDAIYQRCHPHGDPFTVKEADTLEATKLLGIGIGLYWGEGTKSSQHSIRLGNTDPALLRTFMEFLVELFGVRRDDLRFGLQIFTDINQQEALDYWTRELGVKASQFYKVIVTISGSIGTYRKKSQYGVVTLHYHNKKLRDILVDMLPR
jgi:hypothetical protein